MREDGAYSAGRSTARKELGESSVSQFASAVWQKHWANVRGLCMQQHFGYVINTCGRFVKHRI
jgi:hypothetical protein